MTGKPFKYGRLREWGAECFVRRHRLQGGAGTKSHPYPAKGILVVHDRSSVLVRSLNTTDSKSWTTFKPTHSSVWCLLIPPCELNLIAGCTRSVVSGSRTARRARVHRPTFSPHSAVNQQVPLDYRRPERFQSLNSSTRQMTEK